jgi:hypothetical protein
MPFTYLLFIVNCLEESAAITYSIFCSSSVKKDEADTTVQFQQCIKFLADKVYLLTRQSAELLERYSAMQAVHGDITKELDLKKVLIKNLYNKLQQEKQVCLGVLLLQFLHLAMNSHGSWIEPFTFLLIVLTSKFAMVSLGNYFNRPARRRYHLVGLKSMSLLSFFETLLGTTRRSTGTTQTTFCLRNLSPCSPSTTCGTQRT